MREWCYSPTKQVRGRATQYSQRKTERHSGFGGEFWGSICPYWCPGDEQSTYESDSNQTDAETWCPCPKRLPGTWDCSQNGDPALWRHMGQFVGLPCPAPSRWTSLRPSFCRTRSVPKHHMARNGGRLHKQRVPNDRCPSIAAILGKANC